MLLIYFVWPLLLAVATVIYRCFLAHEEILNWWFRFGDKYSCKWFYKPIWGCVYCISGQFALWVYLLSWISSVNFIKHSIVGHFIYKVIPIHDIGYHSLLGGFIFICATIMQTKIVERLYNKYLD